MKKLTHKSLTGEYKFVLDPKTHAVIPEPDVKKWSKWFDTTERLVEQTKLSDGTWISTVFLGLDLRGAFTGRYSLFETMNFAPNGDVINSWKAKTWVQASKRHAKVVAAYTKRGFTIVPRPINIEELTIT